MKERTFGLIRENIIDPRSWIYGGYSGIENKVLIADGQWDLWLPPLELQATENFESMACFLYDAPVLTEDFSYKRISEIKEGEYVITHLGNRKRVIKTIKQEYEGELIVIEIQGLFEPIVSTEEHPFLTENGWKKANELTTKDKVLIPLTNNLISDKTIYEIEKDKDFLWLFGLYLAEGSLGDEKLSENKNPKLKVRGNGNGRGNILFSLHQEEIYIAEKIIKIGNKFGIKFNCYFKKQSKSLSVYGYSVWMRDLFEELGKRYSDKKEINKRLLFLDPELQLEILKGWLAGDGCLENKNRRLTGVSCSRNLIQNFYYICLRNKIKSSLYKRNASGIHKEAFDIRICGEEINKVYGLKLSFSGKANHKLDNFKTDGFLSRKIQKIKKLKHNSFNKVYNLEIEDDHSYIVNFVAVHNCVSFATANCIEALLNRKYNADVNYSDRALAKMSGTKKTGNEMSKVANTARELGLILERYWFFDRQYIKTWEDFYVDIPSDILVKANDFLDEYDLSWEWVYSNDPEKIKEALKYSPLAVAIYAYTPQDRNGYYTRTENWPNHLVVLYGYEDGKCWKIYDQYKNCYKNLAWDFNLGAKIKFDITLKSEKPMPKWTFDNNTLLQLVEGTGGFGLYLDGKIIVDELDKVLASWLVRNNGNTVNKVRAITQEIWDSFPKISLKKEVV